MLLGSHGIFEGNRYRLLSQNPFELMVLDKGRFPERGSPPFQNWYICNGLLPDKIIFEEINKKFLTSIKNNSIIVLEREGVRQ